MKQATAGGQNLAARRPLPLDIQCTTMVVSERFVGIEAMRMFRWIMEFWTQLRREAAIPAPPFRASKRTGHLMYGLWYGRLTIEQARKQAEKWEWPSDRIDEIIARATQPPSYWSQRRE